MECSCEHGNEPSGSMQRGDLFDWLRSCHIADDCAILSWAVSVSQSQSRTYCLKQSTDVFRLVGTVRKRHVEGKEKCISCQIKIGFMKAQNFIGQRQTFIYILRNLRVAPQPLFVIRKMASEQKYPSNKILQTFHTFH